MKASWVTGLDSQKEADLRSNFKGSKVVRARLKHLLSEELDRTLKVRRSKSLYDSPNWPYLQADLGGYERALDFVMNLIED